MKLFHAWIFVLFLAAIFAAVLSCGDKYAAVALPSVDAGPCGATYDDQVKPILDNYCSGCHGGNGGVSVDSYDGASLNADRSLKAMMSGRMPKGGSMPDTDIALVKSWIDNGKQRSCAGGGGGDGGTGTGTVQLTCTSGSYYAGGEGGAGMNPGANCLGCHHVASEDSNAFAAGGTVFGGSHDKNNCIGVAGVTVVLTGQNGTSITMTSNSSGNFYQVTGGTALQTPYTATVTRGGTELKMNTAQTITGCNGCHSAEGANGAPGRILAP